MSLYISRAYFSSYLSTSLAFFTTNITTVFEVLFPFHISTIFEVLKPGKIIILIFTFTATDAVAERSKSTGAISKVMGSNLVRIFFCVPKSGFKTSTFVDVYYGKTRDQNLENCLNILRVKNIDNFLQIEVCPNFMP